MVMLPLVYGFFNMAYITSPNMFLTIPVVGTEPGPNYADDVNNCFTLLDTHDHTPGKGSPITTSALNINADLTLNNYSLTTIKSLYFAAQTTITTPYTLFMKGVDLYVNDGNGSQIRITQSGGIAGTPGSIANLTAPASASYVSGTSTFVFQSNINTAANLDGASVLLRNLGSNTYALTLNPPTSFSVNYSITFPLLPASQKIVTLDNTGAMAADYYFDNSTLNVISNVISVKDSGITTTKINNLAVTEAKLADSAVTVNKIADSSITTSKINSAFQLAASKLTSYVNYNSFTLTSKSGASVTSSYTTLSGWANTYLGSGQTRPIMVSLSPSDDSNAFSSITGYRLTFRLMLQDSNGIIRYLYFTGYQDYDSINSAFVYLFPNMSGAVAPLDTTSITVSLQVKATSTTAYTCGNLVLLVKELI